MKKGTIGIAIVLGVVATFLVIFQFEQNKVKQEIRAERDRMVEEEQKERLRREELYKPWPSKYTESEKTFPDSLIQLIFQTESNGVIDTGFQMSMNQILRETRMPLRPLRTEDQSCRIAIAKFGGETVLIYYGGEDEEETDARVWGIRKEGEVWKTYFSIAKEGGYHLGEPFLWNDRSNILFMPSKRVKNETRTKEYFKFWKIDKTGLSESIELLSDSEWDEEYGNKTVTCRVNIQYGAFLDMRNDDRVEVKCFYSINLYPRCPENNPNCDWKSYHSDKSEKDKRPVFIAQGEDVAICKWSEKKQAFDLKFRDGKITQEHLAFFGGDQKFVETTVFDKDIERIKGTSQAEDQRKLLKVIFGE